VSASAVQQLVIDHMLKARRIARGMLRARSFRGEQLDVEQVAYMALADAARRWDPGQGADFWSYARHRVEGEIRDWKRRESDDVVHIGRHQQEAARARGEEWIKVGYTSSEAVQHVLAHPADDVAALVTHMTLAVLMADAPLSDSQRKVLAGRLADRTGSDIGRELGVTESRACQIERDAMNILRAEAGAEWVPWSGQRHVARGVRVAQIAELAAAGVTEVGAIALRMGITREQAWQYVRRVQALLPAAASPAL
jgi:RNA polymerase sigma factor (sigma-70 family)